MRHAMMNVQKLMVGVAIAIAVPSCIASWFLLSAEYEAGATLRFLRNKQSVLFDNSNSYARSTDYEQHVLTEAGLIVGPVIDRVLNDPEIRDHPYIAKRVDPLLFLQDSVQAQMRPNQELVDIGGAHLLATPLNDIGAADELLGDKGNKEKSGEAEDDLLCVLFPNGDSLGLHEIRSKSGARCANCKNRVNMAFLTQPAARRAPGCLALVSARRA